LDKALQVIVEMTERIGEGFKKDLEDATSEEVNWRPLPEANNITVILRHLGIEAQWHQASLEHGAPMPSEMTEGLQQEIDSVPLDFDRNLQLFDHAYSSFLATLRTLTLVDLEQRSGAAYQAWSSCSAHFLGFHQAMHVAMHWGQIRTLRNLYRKTRGEPARFFPENPTFPNREPDNTPLQPTSGADGRS
jgi:hypothetical protein